MSVQRAEKHMIKLSDSDYKMLDQFCLVSGNVYDHANTIRGHEFAENHRAVSYGDVDQILQTDENDTDYRIMSVAQSAQQGCRQSEKNERAFFESINNGAFYSAKCTGRQKLSKYKKKDSRVGLILADQNAEMIDGAPVYLRSFNDVTRKLRHSDRKDFYEYSQKYFRQKQGCIIAKAVCASSFRDSLPENQRYCSKDMGIDSLAAVNADLGYRAFLISGKGLKSIGQYYNKQLSYYREAVKRMNGKDFTNRMARITAKRNRKIDDYLHKASRSILDYCIRKKIYMIVQDIKKDGKNPGRVNAVFV